DRLLDDLRKRRRDGLERILGVASLGPAEMGQQDDLATLVRDFGDGWCHALKPRRVGDAAVLHGHIEVDAQQHALALHINVIEGTKCFRHWRTRTLGGHSGAMRSIEPGISKFRVWSFG